MVPVVPVVEEVEEAEEVIRADPVVEVVVDPVVPAVAVPPAAADPDKRE